MPTTATTIERAAPPLRTSRPDRGAPVRPDRLGWPLRPVRDAGGAPLAPNPAPRPGAAANGPADSATGSRHRVGVATIEHGSLVPEASEALDDVTVLDPDPGLLCANLAVCVVEILAGARALDQLGRWVTDSVYIHLLRRTVLAARARAVSAQEARRPRFHIGDPLLSYPSDDVVEGVVMVHQPSRSRAIALRLERRHGRWRATAISVL